MNLGKKNVGTENKTGYGTAVDICVKTGGITCFYEVKTGNNIKSCIREAVGQILEYAFYPDVVNAQEMTIVSPNPPSDSIRRYLAHLRKKLGIHLYYQQYDLDKRKLASGRV